MRLFLDTKNVRAWPGGPGEHKIGGNYAPTVMPQMSAMADHRCNQVRLEPQDAGSNERGDPAFTWGSRGQSVPESFREAGQQGKTQGLRHELRQ